MGIVRVVDETTSGGRSGGWGLECVEGRLALREVVRRRVVHEVAAGELRGLVQPTEAERVLNGYAVGATRRVDAERQVELALAAFERNGFLVLVGDRQIEDLDEEIELSAGVEVTFLKLVPLVGG